MEFVYVESTKGSQQTDLLFLICRATIYNIRLRTRHGIVNNPFKGNFWGMGKICSEQSEIKLKIYEPVVSFSNVLLKVLDNQINELNKMCLMKLLSYY